MKLLSRSFARLGVLFATLCAASFAMAQAPVAAASPTAPASGWFARVAGVEISAAEYDYNAREAFRTRFFHGRPPEAEVNWMLREVGEMMIDRVLLLRAADDRKVVANPKEVDVELDLIDKRNAANPAWAAEREQYLPAVRAEVVARQRRAAVEKAVREVTASTEEVRRFYDQNPKLFTEPTKNRVSLILFRVHPSSPAKEWETAMKQAEAARAEIEAGADFAALARERSKDPSAPNGGDLGYLHEGMLAGGVEEAIAKMAPGALGGPTQTLEGYAIYRLQDRTPARLRDFASVESRAKELYLRRKSDDDWLAFLDSLRKGAAIEIGPAFEKIMQTPRPGAAK